MICKSRQLKELRTERTTVKRSPSRGKYGREDLFEVLDAAYVCQIGFLHDQIPYVIPTAYGRDNEYIYLHGSTKSRLILNLLSGQVCCINVTLLDGLVLARSVFHHSMNYRSAVIIGKAEELVGEAKMRGLKIITEHILKGRWGESRSPNDKEMKATAVVRIPLQEGSVKVRTGPPKDEKEDYDLDIWAGELPISTEYGKPLADPDGNRTIEIPDSIKKMTDGRHNA